MAPTKTKSLDFLSLLEPPIGTNERLLLLVVGSNWEQMSLSPTDIELVVGAGTKTSLVSSPTMDGTNAKDQKPFV